MKVLEKIGLIAHVLRWRLTWGKRDLGYRPPGVVPGKFITAREAATLIHDGQTVFSCGFAGTARCSVFFWAIRERFQETGHPAGLTWINVAAQGGRGKVPGTVEELGLPGLMSRYITGHLETTRAQLALAEAGQLDLHVLPQGVMTRLLEAQGRGEKEINSRVGLGTVMDPATGRGSRVAPDSGDQLVSSKGDLLCYTMPEIEVVLLQAPSADQDGNIYFDGAASINENLEAVAAARRHGGTVMVTVSEVTPADQARISIPACDVDYIIVHPYNEQSASIRQSRYWPELTPGQKRRDMEIIHRIRFINTFLKITPVRDHVDDLLCRQAADLILREVPEGTMANIGVGYPEHVVWELLEQGRSDHLRFTTEAGSDGGIPLPGIFFGTALFPDRLISSAAMFHLYHEQLGLAVLGFLQVDEEGNVNASLRGDRIRDEVGPGGFMDIVYGARTILFVGSWQANARFAWQNGQLRVVRRGVPKFVRKVDQVTFSAKEALKMGKKVYYVTHVGVFRLTTEGLELQSVMPGMDLQRDILEGCQARLNIDLNLMSSN